jgi:hypothetical protein
MSPTLAIHMPFEPRRTGGGSITDLPDMASPHGKSISLYQKFKSVLLICLSHPNEGRAHVTNARWDAVDADCATDECA